MGDWKITSRRGALGSSGGDTTYTVKNKETGETQEHTVSGADKESELEQLGEILGESFDDDGDD